MSLAGMMHRFLVTPPSMSKPLRPSFLSFDITGDSLAEYTRSMRSPEYIALPAIHWNWKSWRSKSRKVFSVGLHRGPSLVYVVPYVNAQNSWFCSFLTKLSLHCSQVRLYCNSCAYVLIYNSVFSWVNISQLDIV